MLGSDEASFVVSMKSSLVALGVSSGAFEESSVGLLGSNEALSVGFETLSLGAPGVYSLPFGGLFFWPAGSVSTTGFSSPFTSLRSIQKVHKMSWF